MWKGKGRMRREFLQYLTEAPLLWLGIALLSALIFLADTVTDLEIAFAVLYVAVILISVRSGRQQAVFAVGIVCAALTIISYLLTRHGDTESGMVNGALSLLAIGATTYLAIRIETIEAGARQAQSELARMSRIMIVGELGTSIAHEVSQPITAIAANGNAALRWLSASPADEQEARQALDRIVKDAERAGEVIGRVRSLVAHASPPQDRIDMTSVITEALALLRNEIRANHIHLRTELAGDLPPVTGDRVQLQQVVLNFVINAIEAMGGVDAEKRALLVSAATDARKITVSVRDTGVGLPAASSGEIFAAFYTTKPGGMGMGLTISRSIIEAHGGRVYMAPNFPHGAVFGFILPSEARVKG